MEKRKMPGGAMTRRPLHFVFLLDISGSMNANGKIEALNNAIREAIPAMRDVTDKVPGVHLLVRAITFSTTALWHIKQPTSIDTFRWTDVAAGGETNMGAAFELLSESLSLEDLGARALAPVLVLISDGRPTDDFKGGLGKLMAQPWGALAIREAVAIGSDADLKYLQLFIGDEERKPLRANRPEALVERIKDVSREAVKQASTPTVKLRERMELEEEQGGSVW
jgi:uncharacterized protein YegL